MNEVRTLACDGNATPVVVKETPSTALVDAQNGLGSVRVISVMYDWFVDINIFHAGRRHLLHGACNRESQEDRDCMDHMCSYVITCVIVGAVYLVILCISSSDLRICL